MLTSGMQALVEDITKLVDDAEPDDLAGPDAQSDIDRRIAMATTVAERLRSALPAGEALLTPELRAPDSDRYCQHVAYVDPRGRFSVVSLVWLPGQATPVHDHLCWCVVGVLLGQEEETRFDAHETPTGEIDALLPGQTMHNQPGSVSWLVPSRRDIHLVKAVAPERATVSLHVYGEDITTRGSSIKRIYDSGLVAR